MRNKTSQPGFTLIELIAVMVILGILAAVIIPRISTLTQGAYESNVRSMFGVIKNEVNAQALKAAMRGGSGGHREKFPLITDRNALNYYLDRWVDEYDDALWVEQGVSGPLNTSWANTNKFSADAATPDVLIFGYFPHGIHSTAYDDGWGGTSTDKEDIYFIYYMPITTLRGEANGYDYDGFVMVAAQDADLDQTPDIQITIDESGDVTVTNNGDEVIEDITYISSADPDS